MTIFSFLEVLESTCCSLGSKAKHRSVYASGNALLSTQAASKQFPGSECVLTQYFTDVCQHELYTSC